MNQQVNSLKSAIRLGKRHAVKATQKATQNSSTILFLRELFAHPAAAGAPWPSSRHLGKRMAAPVALDGQGLVIEVGAGTGVITQALLDRGVGAERLLVVERSPLLFEHLRKRFPHLRVVLGDAAQLQTMIPDGAKIDALVSSVPLRSLPFMESEAIVAHWQETMPTGTLLVQFTYALTGPLRHLSARLKPGHTSIAWRNFPPARVVCFEFG